MLAGKAVDLGRLKDELLVASIAVADLRNTAGDIRELKTDGSVAELPAGARAVIDAHVGPDQQATVQAAATTDLLAKVVAAYQRLTQIQQQATTLQTQMAALKTQADSVATMTNTQVQSVATIKSIAAGVSTLATGLSGTAAAVSDEAVDIQFLARQIAAGLGVNVTDAG